jgi:antitoxin component of MazEF toxin-antitoxin module
MNLDSGSEVDVRSNGQEIVIRRVPGKHSLEELVSRINESNRHAEVEIQPIRGKEAW